MPNRIMSSCRYTTNTHQYRLCFTVLGSRTGLLLQDYYANEPDIVLTDQSTNQAMLIDITIPRDENLMKAVEDTLTMYLDLDHEVATMCDQEMLIEKRWHQAQIQKEVLLDTARIVRKFLSVCP